MKIILRILFNKFIIKNIYNGLVSYMTIKTIKTLLVRVKMHLFTVFHMCHENTKAPDFTADPGEK